MKQVTWLLPVKDGMPYLPQTLKSIEAQTYKDWEVLAWDNGSSDGTLAELRRWIPTRIPGRVVTGRPLGLGASLSEMMTEVQSDLCARIDADDVNSPLRLERQTKFLREHPSVDVVGSLANRIDSEGREHGLLCDYPANHDDIVHTMLVSNPIAHPTVLFRRNAVLESGNYRNVGEINIEDYDLWLRVAVRHKLANIQEALLNYRVHPKSTTQIALAQNRLESAMNFRFCEHASDLFGCSTQDAELLRQKRHPNAAKLLYGIAEHLQKSQGGSVKARLKSQSFLHAARQLVGKSDIRSRWSIIRWS